NGEIKVMYTHFEEASIPITGGSAVSIRSFTDSRLETHTKNIIKKINYSGWGLAEYKYCERRNDYVFMEINAKFWASCQLAFDNEPKFSALLLNIIKPAENNDRILFLNRFLRNVLLLFISNL